MDGVEPVNRLSDASLSAVPETGAGTEIPYYCPHGSEQAVFEPRSRESWRDPFTMYRALRDHDPVHHVEPGGEDDDYWVLSRWREVLAAAIDWESTPIDPLVEPSNIAPSAA